MTVSKRMTINPVTCTPDMGVLEVYEKMKEEGVRRLPVLDSEGNLVGVISEANILNAATEKKVSLLGFAYELAHLSVGQIMSREVITVNMDDPVEQAARKMSDFDVTILPVVNYNGKLVGVVTRSDMFKLLLELFGTRHYGIRVSFTIDDKPGIDFQLKLEEKSHFKLEDRNKSKKLYFFVLSKEKAGKSRQKR